MFFQGKFQSMKEPGLFLPGSGSYHTSRTLLRILIFSKQNINKNVAVLASTLLNVNDNTAI